MDDRIVCIVDDDQSALRAISRLIQSHGYKVEKFQSANQFIQSNYYRSPGCVVLDYKMPTINGVQLQQKMIEDGNLKPVIFLSAHGDIKTTANVFKKGAIDFLIKPVDKDELIEAIELSLKVDTEERDRQTVITEFNDKVNSLTPKEYEVLTYVITGLLNKQIAGYLDISEETVKIHRGRVMKKLGLVSVAGLVRKCEKAGIQPAIEMNI